MLWLISALGGLLLFVAVLALELWCRLRDAEADRDRWKREAWRARGLEETVRGFVAAHAADDTETD